MVGPIDASRLCLSSLWRNSAFPELLRLRHPGLRVNAWQSRVIQTNSEPYAFIRDEICPFNGKDVKWLYIIWPFRYLSRSGYQNCIKALSTCVVHSSLVLDWISSYLTEPQQCVVHSESQSSYDNTMFGVPQSSFLGQLLFVLYIADLVLVIQQHDLHLHLYADDTLVYTWCPETSHLWKSVCQNASMTRQCNSNRTGCSWTPPRRSTSGAHLSVVVSTFQSTTSRSGRTSSIQSSRLLGVVHRTVDPGTCSWWYLAYSSYDW